ncbi:MAG: SUMF1/EgtB/PvdO family nonheme iron enzyme [Chloroflexota bacterium]|nr:SUMF1/EgtB/PvdO family nonheme iron enzyme [Chloroflexota bacterium]
MTTRSQHIILFVTLLVGTIVFSACVAPVPQGAPQTVNPAAQSADGPVASAETVNLDALPDVAPSTGPIETWTNPVDGTVYVLVPAGEFLMGSTDADPWAGPGEKPQQTVDLGEFWIMQTKVTNGQYNRCMEEGACTEPRGDRWNDPAFADHPVVRVDLNQAMVYADWVGGRLPTEEEWEKACRGTDGRLFPWGNEYPDAELLNFVASVDDTTPVQAYSPQGDSPYGVIDMSGNVWEWTDSMWDDGLDWRVLRGGDYNSDVTSVRCAWAFNRGNPEVRFGDIGFRVLVPATP